MLCDWVSLKEGRFELSETILSRYDVGCCVTAWAVGLLKVRLGLCVMIQCEGAGM